MAEWKQEIRSRLIGSNLEPAREAEIVEELSQHLADRYTESLAGGAAPDEAYRTALMDLNDGGSLARELQRVERSVEQEPIILGTNRRTYMIADLWQDLRFAARMLVKKPGFTLIVIITLSLGIGANTAIFTLINVVMLKSLPVSHPEELVMLTRSSGDSRNPSSINQALWEQIRDRQDIFSGVCAYGSTSADLSTGGEARPVSVGLVSGGFFSTLGVRPVLGRTLTDADDQRGCSLVAVITHAFWQSEYGGSADIVGKSVAINGRQLQIVGVAEPAFFGVEYGYNAPIWAPQCAGTIIRPGASSGGGWIIGRLKPNGSLEQSRARLATLTPGILEATLPTDANAEAAAQYRESTFGVVPFAKGLQGLSRTYGDALLILMAIVGAVLLIACANIANLQLARGAARRHEIGVRLALGASRSRLIRQLLTEGLLLSLAGAAFGLLFAHWGSRVLVGFLARHNQVVALDLTPDLRVLAFTFLAGALTGLLFGLAPAWRAAHVDPLATLKPSGRGAAEGHSRFSTSRALVVAQIALSLVMIAGAGLLLSSWRRIVSLDPGFRSEGVLLVSVATGLARIPAEQRGMTYSRILERLRAIPGVAVASVAWRTPFGGNARIPIDVEGFTPPSGDDARVQMNQVSEGYFATLRTPILAGRDFNQGDTPALPEVAIVNEELARKFFGGARALGQHFRVPSGDGFSQPIEIIGIVANTKEFNLREANLPIAYFSLSQETRPGPSFNFALRTEGSPAALIPSVKAALAEIEPRFILNLRTLQQRLDETTRVPRTIGMLSGFFGALALLLAALGLYGVISYSVVRRRKEIGIRIALGATRVRIIRMALGEVGRMVVAGVALGVLLALAVTRLMATFLYGVEPNEPATLAFSAIILAVVAFGASLLPAWRAARLDPMAALHDD